MFCFQCEQTTRETGCITRGVCEKDPTCAALQDLIVEACKGIGMYAHRARVLGVTDDVIDAYIPEALFATVTQVNFDAERTRQILIHLGELTARAQSLYESACKNAGREAESLAGATQWMDGEDLQSMVARGDLVSIKTHYDENSEDIVSLQEILMYGLKGMVAYAYHARVQGVEDADIDAYVLETLDYLTHDDHTIDDLVAQCMKCGEMNLKVMEMLDRGNTTSYGHPEPTSIRVEPVKGKAIAVSGHELKSLYEVLEQTEGKGINVYTHGELLPALAYPAFKKFNHLVGNYGGAWMRQRTEFADFPGAVLVTTNCIQLPNDSYKDRLFTCGPTAWEGVTHISDGDYTPVIEAALAAEGFSEDGPDEEITIGFARNTVMSVADKVIDAVKAGAIKSFFLIGGCDGAKTGRNYYTELAEAVPNDSVILTLGCGKYRFHRHDFGDIGGIPRLLDLGQCNDAYSAIQIAAALADAFGTDVNGLPLSLNVSWYEQKAVSILLSLLHLGIKNIRLGPSLPEFISPNVLNFLVEQFNIGPVTTVEEDMKAIAG
ncbi:MAG: hydroxylamine reductase [Planctomycetota bacterium]|jgi:hydroxylamine reductase|nr:hydroxylamine reductase [Planctomycetota bacterium]